MALWNYAWLIPALPALAAGAIALFGKRTPEKGGWLAVLLVGLAGALSLGVFYESWQQSPVSFDEPHTLGFEWFRAGDKVLNMGLYVDPLTIFMLFTVGILVTLIALYSTGYMHEEGDARRRYYAELTLFITGMLGLVVSSNYLMLFVFWEIMGLCSYLLIGYWYAKPSAASAAKKAFLTTRVGDAFFLVGLGILFVQFKTLDFAALFDAAANGAPGVDRGALLLANSCIFIGAVGKSAQFPLHTWLPDAMEGPTTVSALIHAATMVKAGVYLVARSFPLFVLTPELLVAVAIVGGFTALFAATMALTNWDLKRVLAYSTLSQLGYMFLGLGVAGALYSANPSGALATVALASVGVAVFHLFSHAFFKAGLFLSAGSVGHAMHGAENPYDMRAMGGLRKWMPITAFAMLMGTISISGVPPFSGFFSKDGIVHAVYEVAHLAGGTLSLVYWALFAMAVLTAGLTAYYMFRLYFLTFEGDHRGVAYLRGLNGDPAPLKSVGKPSTAAPHHAHAGPAASAHVAHAHEDHHDDHGHHIHEAPWSMTVPLAILGTMALIGGIVAFAIAHGEVASFIRPSENAIAAAGVEGVEIEAGHGIASAVTHPFAAITTYVTLAAAAIGIGAAWMMWGPGKAERNIKSDAQTTGMARVWQRRYYIDPLYDRAFGWGSLKLAAGTDWFDREVVDGAVNGVAKANAWSGERIRRWNTGFVQDYALTMLAGFLLIVLAVMYAPTVSAWVDALRARFTAILLGGL